MHSCSLQSLCKLGCSYIIYVYNCVHMPVFMYTHMYMYMHIYLQVGRTDVTKQITTGGV